MNYKDYIAEIKDFPVNGILFRDITPLIGDKEAFKKVTDELTEFARSKGADVIVGPESRGFIFGCPVAYALGVGFVPIRKPGKLPREFVSASYSLEYGTNTLCMHKDAIKPNQKVVIIDDLLATGGTTHAAIDLVKQLKGEVVGVAYLIELTALHGCDNLPCEALSIIKY